MSDGIEVRLQAKTKNPQLDSGGNGDGEFKLPAKSIHGARKLAAHWVRTNPDFSTSQAVIVSPVMDDLGGRNVLEIIDYKDGKRHRKSKMRKAAICKLIDIAFLWHSGGGSPLYSFASTRTVHSELHRANILKEIKEDIRYVEIPKDERSLERLAKFVEKAPIGQEVCSNDDMTAHWK